MKNQKSVPATAAWRLALSLAGVLLPGVLLTAACGQSGTPEQAPAEAAGLHGDPQTGLDAGTVHLDPDQARQAGIVTMVVRYDTLRDRFVAPARAVADLTGSASVGTLVPGRIVELYANEGTIVRRGTPLAAVESFEVAELKAEFLQAHAQAEQADADFERHRQLADDQLTPVRELELAQAASHSARAAVAAAATKLSALGIDPDSVPDDGTAQDARFVVRSPIDGVVTKREIQLGEYVDPSRDLYDVVGSGSRLVESQVPVDRAVTLVPGQRATVLLAGGDSLLGRVESVAPVVAAESRTVPVRVSLRGDGLRPETFVSVSFDIDAVRRALVVPVGAVERTGGGTFVYIAESGLDGTFRRMPVEVGREAQGGIVITSGLAPGQVIATEGVFYLRSALLKGELAEHD